MRYIFTIVLMMALATVGMAQITITYDDYAQMTSSATSTTYTAENTANAQFDIGSTGGGQTWDLTGFTFTQETNSNTFIDPATTPYASQFPSATHAVFTQTTEGDGYAYFILDQSGMYFIGVVGSAQGQEFSFEYDPPRPEVKFPATLNSSWTYNGNPIDLGGVATNQWRSETEIDGAGTLVLPQGSYDCLRMRTTEWLTSKVEFNGQVISEQVTKNVSYTFMTKGGVNASILADTTSPETGTITASDISYNVFGGTTAIRDLALSGDFALNAAYPNPLVSGAQTTIAWNLPVQSEVSVNVYDARGREVAKVFEGRMNTGAHAQSVSTAGLVPGTYFVRMAAGGEVRTTSIAVIR